MSCFVQSFLETEITSLPQTMQHYLGKFYNNTLYNGLTWMVLILLFMRFLFELVVNALLKRMGFKEYLRLRLRKSLWYLGFYTCSHLYCSATIWKNGITLPEQEKFVVLRLAEPISGHLILGYILLCAFFTSSSMWEGLLYSFSSFNYLFLTGFVAFTYFLSYIELAVLLGNSICAYHITTEFSRCLSCTVGANLNLPRQLVNLTFVLSIVIFVNAYLIVIPGGFLLPMVRSLLYNSNSSIVISLNVTLWGWFLCEMYASPLFKLMLHQWRHESNTTNIVPECLGSAIDCALFQPRDDVAYNLNAIRKEIKEQEARLTELRQPKRRARMLLQTLKCVAAINRRIKHKRQAKEVEEDNWSAEDEQEVDNKIFDLDSIEHEASDTVVKGGPLVDQYESASVLNTKEDNRDTT